MFHTVNTENNVKKKNKLQHGSNIFYAALMAFPIVQFLIFYIAVNVGSFAYAFKGQDVNTVTGEIVWKFTVSNITDWFTGSKWQSLLEMSQKSLLYYGINLAVSIPLGLLFAYYVFKKMPASGFFRVMLFLPSIIPVAAFALTYKIILNDVVPVLFDNIELSFDSKPLFYVIFYNLYISFGASVLMYANKMFDISPELIEAAELDGATGIKEFWYVVLPLTFPTLSVFLVTGVATLFTNQYSLFLFMNNESTELDSLGYHLYLLAGKTNTSEDNIPPVSALGLILSAIALPLTFAVKYCLDKFGPSED